MRKKNGRGSMAELRELVAEMARQNVINEQELKKGMEELKQRMEESSLELKKSVDRTTKNVDNLTSKWGRFVERFVEPGLESAMATRGIEIRKTYNRVRGRIGGEHIEIDILGLNGDCAVVVEVKSTLTPDDIKDHIEHLKQFKRFFPEYGNKKLLGAIASVDIEKSAELFAYKQGLFVLTPFGESLRVINDEQFKPKEW